MFTVYALYSQAFQKIYIGYAADLQSRFQSYNYRKIDIGLSLIPMISVCNCAIWFHCVMTLSLPDLNTILQVLN
ncbi:MAG: GIY-YIG nuclease family protein [Cyclobacteriaceae bacterium]|nr:GIY-YIG nuclease family protein [Cyclobacteriaceae bacterium]